MRNDQSNINSCICLQIIQKRLQYNFIITLHSKMQIKTKCFIFKHLVDNFWLHCYLEKSIPKLYCSEKWSISTFQDFNNVKSLNFYWRSVDKKMRHVTIQCLTVSGKCKFDPMSKVCALIVHIDVNKKKIDMTISLRVDLGLFTLKSFLLIYFC